MRRYQKWLTMGLLALTPGVTLAGPLNSPLLKQSTSANHPAAAPKKAGPNQELANKVAAALKKAKLSGYEIEISVDKGVATLDGMVGSPAQREAAAKVAGSVSGISRVNNRLGVGDSAPRMPAYQAPVHAAAQVPQAAAAMRQAPPTMPRAAARPQMVRPANYQQGYEGQEPIQQPLPPQPIGQLPTPMPPQMAGVQPGGPAYGPPAGGATNAIYNQPNFPNYSWPTYAQYPNYAAVNYPSQYAASAWPYIGPFYPYPQVPLGWRKAQLEWDDGYWNLNFRPRTERWWWFLDPKNW